MPLCRVAPGGNAQGLRPSTAAHLPGSGFRRFVVQDIERLRAEMFEQVAPATEGLTVNPGRKRSGRLVFGDATE